MERTRILVVSGSAIDRRVLSRRLAREPDMQVVGAGSDARSVRDLVFRTRPHVVMVDAQILDAAFRDLLDEILESRSVPVVAFASNSAASVAPAPRAREGRRIEVVRVGEGGQDLLLDRLVGTIRRVCRESGREESTDHAAETVVVPQNAGFPTAPGRCVVAVGASTGGTAAIETILRALPANCPPVVVCQHMPAAFTAPFARRLDAVCELSVVEVDVSVSLDPGIVAVAQGERHLVVTEGRAGIEAVVAGGSPVHHQKPAVDVLFRSLATVVGSRGVGVLLTGMGQDGAAGLLEMRRAGAHTIAQDESTSAIYGMPREAVEVGAVAEVLPLDDIAAGIRRAVTRLARRGPGDPVGRRAEAEVAATHPPCTEREPRKGRDSVE